MRIILNAQIMYYIKYNARESASERERERESSVDAFDKVQLNWASSVSVRSRSDQLRFERMVHTSTTAEILNNFLLLPPDKMVKTIYIYILLLLMYIQIVKVLV